MASSGPAALNISLGGTDFGGTSDGGQASLGKEVRESRAVMLTPSTQAMIEVSSEPGMVKGSSKSGGLAVVPGDALGPGNAFRVIAYRGSDGSYQGHQDYVVGGASTPLHLDEGGIAYTLVAYSYGTSTLPAISAGEMNNISRAVVSYDNSNPDFMYQQLSVIPRGHNNPLMLTLRHKLSLLTATLDVTNLGMGAITSVSNSRITPHSTTGTIALSTGIMTRGVTTANVPVTFSGPFPQNVVSSLPVWVNANASSRDDVNPRNVRQLLANITVGGTSKSLTIPSFTITPERRQNIRVKFTTCGAYVGPNTNPANFRAFQCHNV
ncbi:hypothetical protein BBD32_12645 [Elizabethkingia anophelis]|uniref:Uncharacterized protein n=2 Tax=Elizabethkingia anophelis TaxID=1117645 RepID=A0AAU8UW93_9FLAO|nr:hypothetical protein BBD32_12645 [Elizabethkingia anophelis]